MSKKLSFEDACFQWASNQFLYEEIPDEYFKWSEDTQHEHLERYAWEPISHHYGYRIASYIDSLAQHAIKGIIPKRIQYKKIYADCPVDKDWSDPEKRELFIQKISDLAFGVDTIERGYPMEEVMDRLEKFCEFSHKWEEHSGEESC